MSNTQTNITPPKALTIFKKVIQFILYLPIQIAFLPLIIIGLLIGIYKEIGIGQKKVFLSQQLKHFNTGGMDTILALDLILFRSALSRNFLVNHILLCGLLWGL